MVRHACSDHASKSLQHGAITAGQASVFETKPNQHQVQFAKPHCCTLTS
jgi:hypothetical protein